MRINVTHLILMLPWFAACGDDRNTASAGETAGSTTNVSAGESGTGSEAGTESGTESESGSETETGEPGNLCDTCTADELCVAHADDSCNAVSGYTLSCVPVVAACENGECDPECLDMVCGNDICTPPCGNVPGVDVWCSGEMANGCDPIAQDCPEGEKCVAWASQGGAWDATKCVPVTGTNMVGDPCMSAGVVEATDDCDENGMCFGLDDSLMGVCYGFCSLDGTCPDAQLCFFAGDGSITLCIDECQPHHPDNCGAGTTCVQIDGTFICLPVQTILPPDSPCTEFDYCPLGQTCVLGIDLDNCAGQSCCTDWCDTSMADPCTMPETCQPYWQMGQAPPGLDTAGVCKL
jgi:hypothetical protein